MSFAHGGDLCLGFWAQHYDHGRFALPHGARVLEIGSAEADWLTPMRAQRPDLGLVGIDVRACSQAGVIRGDVLTQDFPKASFDAVVSISAIEHIGLGAYGDPIEPSGDLLAMERAVTWVKPGGWLYLDVPYGPTYRVGRNHRRYDALALASRLIPDGTLLRWAEVHRPDHPDAPFISLLLDRI